MTEIKGLRERCPLSEDYVCKKTERHCPYTNRDLTDFSSQILCHDNPKLKQEQLESLARDEVRDRR